MTGTGRVAINKRPRSSPIRTFSKDTTLTTDPLKICIYSSQGEIKQLGNLMYGLA